MSRREILLVAHTGRETVLRSARHVVERLSEAGIGVRVLAGEAAELACSPTRVVPTDAGAADGVELVVVLGGDGTLLRAAELSRPAAVPLLGINLGRVGFLAEAEPADLTATLDGVVGREYDVEERLTLDVTVRHNGAVVGREWALNDASVEKSIQDRMLDVLVEVDGRPLSRWGCDGVVAATPTGSTAYAFSAGGPVVWPEVQALLLVPISAHALFSRALVVSPSSLLAIDLTMDNVGGGLLWCDGRRTVELARGARVEVGRGDQPVMLARLHPRPFTDRLVAKFALPVDGWRGRPV